jgi:small subunit ribosomal protein S7
MTEEMKIFGIWDISGVKVQDAGLERYISLRPSLVPKSGGRHAAQPFHRSKMNIVERLITKLMVPGHHGKKHRLTSGRATGKYFVNYKTVKNAFEKIENQTKKNPIEVLVRAVENAALREEISAYQIGGIIVRRAVTTSPQRRVDLALRSITQSSYKKSFGKKDKMATVLANELIAAAANDASKSESVKEKERIERESESSR